MTPAETSFGEQLIELMSLLNIKATDLAKRVSMKPQTLASFTGARGSEPTLKTIRKFLTAFPEVSPDWLINGHGQPFRGTQINQTGNAGNFIGQMSGGTVNYTLDDCRAALEECEKARTKLTTELAHARGRIIELLDKQ